MSSLVIDNKNHQCLEFSSGSCDESKDHHGQRKKPAEEPSTTCKDSRITLKTPPTSKKTMITSRKRRRTLEPGDIRTTTEKNLKTIIAKYEQSCIKNKKKSAQ